MPVTPAVSATEDTMNPAFQEAVPGKREELGEVFGEMVHGCLVTRAILCRLSCWRHSMFDHKGQGLRIRNHSDLVSRFDPQPA